jgi:hypothetical protein
MFARGRRRSRPRRRSRLPSPRSPRHRSDPRRLVREDRPFVPEPPARNSDATPSRPSRRTGSPPRLRPSGRSPRFHRRTLRIPAGSDPPPGSTARTLRTQVARLLPRPSRRTDTALLAATNAVGALPGGLFLSGVLSGEIATVPVRDLIVVSSTTWKARGRVHGIVARGSSTARLHAQAAGKTRAILEGRGWRWKGWSRSQR